MIMNDENCYTVYIHINKINGKKYIGITRCNPEKRWKNGNGYNKNDYFRRSIEKYGWDNYEHEILFSRLTKSDARKKEASLIGEFQTFNKKYGYNLTHGGECGDIPTVETRQKISKANSGERHPMFGKFGKKHTEKTKQKIGESSKGRNVGVNSPNFGKFGEEHPSFGRKRSIESRKKMSEANQGERHPMFGKKHSPESRQKISEALAGKNNPNFGRKFSSEVRQKMSEAKKGNTPSPETRRKISEANTGEKNCRFGIKHTEETRRKMAAAWLVRKAEKRLRVNN
jgi:group I intron endonuclease